MSTVLEKPVLLDETGQAIVGKLEDIKNVIGTTGEFIPILIKVTTSPTKTSYLAGEALDLTGIVVKLEASNGAQFDITQECSFSPANGTILSGSDTSVTITYHWYKDNIDFTTVQPISMKQLSSISVTTPPTTTEYVEGETLDLTGIVVTAIFDDNTTDIVTNDCVFNPSNGTVLSVSDTIINISYSLGGITKTTTQSISVSYLIYGAEWDGSATTTWSRTDSAANFTDPVPQMSNGSGGWTDGSSPFDSILPWSGMERVEDADVGTLVKIPKYYYKITQNGNAIKIQISAGNFSGAKVSPAHEDRGDGQGERDFVYIGAYHCGNSYKSITNVNPVAIKPDIARTNIHNNGTDIWQMDYAIYMTIVLLYLVEFANWNSQGVIGYGCGQNSPLTTGQTDSMTYHTGTNASNRATYQHVKYRHIEDLWANVFNWLDGLRIKYSSTQGFIIAACKNPNDFSDLSKYTDLYVWNYGNVNGVAKTFDIPTTSGFEFVILPKSAQYDSTYSSYTCDQALVNPLNNIGSYFLFGGNTSSKTQNAGLFCLRGVDESSTNGVAGARLMKLPNNS